MKYIFVIGIIVVIGILAFLYFQTKKRVPLAKVRFESKFLKLGERTLHYIQEGKGPHVVMLHGIGASTYTWRFMVEKLARTYTVTAVDLLGFGLSSKPADFSYSLDDQCLVLDEFFNKLGMKQVRVVASSMGGAIAIWYAKIHPEKVLELVTISPALDPGVLRYDLQKLQFLGPFVSPLVTRTFVKQVMRRVLNKTELITDESVDAYYRPYSEPGSIQSFIKSIAILRDSRLVSDLADFKTPLLIIWGVQDKIVPLRVGEDIRKRFSNIRFVTHPTAGHHVMEDDPDWVFEQVREFFDTHID